MAGLIVSATLAALFICAAPQAVDGDTLRCRGLGLVRLLHIDAPELPGHCRPGRACTPGDGYASTAHLTHLIQHRPVRCAPTGRDTYGRILASCLAAGTDISCAQVSSGHAIERYGHLICRD